MENKISVGRKIKQIRLNLGETMETFGERFKVGKGTVNNWEKDRNLPNKRNLKKIADLEGVTVKSLLSDNIEYVSIICPHCKKNFKTIKEK